MKLETRSDEVFGQFNKPVAGEGTYADYVAAPAGGLIARKPAFIDFAQASAPPTVGLTALESVNAVAPREGDTVLIVGAAGGVGSYAVQVAAHRGARVIATGRSGREDYRRSLGAGEVVDYTTGDIVETVKSSHPEGIDGLIDVVSRDPATLQRNADVLRPGGRVASAMGAVNPEALAQQGIEGTNVVAGSTTGPGGLEKLAAMVTAGELKVPIAHVYSLEDAPAALERLQSGVQGKLVLDCRA